MRAGNQAQLLHAPLCSSPKCRPFVGLCHRPIVHVLLSIYPWLFTQKSHSWTRKLIVKALLRSTLIFQYLERQKKSEVGKEVSVVIRDSAIILPPSLRVTYFFQEQSTNPEKER